MTAGALQAGDGRGTAADPLRVLFVEDSAVDAELIAAELKRGGHEVRYERVDTEEAFLGALTASQWDLIISDFSMPHFDGLTAYKVYSRQNYDIPFIFVTGSLDEETAVESIKAGASDYVTKPVDADQLIGLLRVWLSR